MKNLIQVIADSIKKNEGIQPVSIAAVEEGKYSVTMSDGHTYEGEIGYKVFEPDFTCRCMQYEVGHAYEENLTPSLCNRGLHYCLNAADCFNYYSFNPENKAALVLAYGEIDKGDHGEKHCTNKLLIVREIPWSELLQIVNTGNSNAGLSNSGSRNSGDYNSGSRNSGSRNSGSRNSGSRNSGSRNSGSRNSGDYNSGSRNSGSRNSGDYNSGDYNSGSRNSGDYNSGDYNSGRWNWGDHNTGDFNMTNYSSGAFCTEEPHVILFNKDSGMTQKEWRGSRAYHLLCMVEENNLRWVCDGEMTQEEKEAHPDCEVRGGYLRHKDDPQCFIRWWNGLCSIDKRAIMNIPNFDAVIFKQITGIDVNDPNGHTKRAVVKREFGVGEVVTIASGTVAELDHKCRVGFNGSMQNYCGKKARITSRWYSDNYNRYIYSLDVDNGRWNWEKSLFETVYEG